MATEKYAEKTVFVSYAVGDQEPHRWLERLRLQIRPLEERYHFEFWDDSKIQPGKKWKREIEHTLGRASAAVLLVGPAFLASDFIKEVELPLLLRRQRLRGIALLILITQYSNFGESKLAEFQAFRPENRPLSPLEALPVSSQNKVLRDFSLAIKNAVERHSPNGPERVRHNLPIKQTNVVGRDPEIDSLLSSLEDQDKPVILASGFGGVGKSTVANVAAWKCVERQQPFKLIAWLDVRKYNPWEKTESITLGFVLDGIAKVTNPTSEILSIGDLEVKAARIRELLANTRSLLVLDNYESLLVNPEEEEKIARFIGSLPIGPSGGHNRSFVRVLITTRVVSPTLNRLPIYNKGLHKLPFLDSLKMMTRRSDAPKLTNQQWKRVWQMLHGLPKYMQVAVEQLTAMTFLDWEEKVKEIRWQPQSPDDFFFDLFDFSWRNPAIVSEDLRRILLAMTYFVGHARPTELRSTSGLSKGRFRDALPSRFNASYLEVVREETGQEYYTLHPLMYAYCSAALNSESFRELQEQFGARFVDCLLRFAEDASANNALDLLDQESQNIVAAARIGGRLELWENLVRFRTCAADFMRYRGSWYDYSELVELAVEACRAMGKEVLLAQCLVYDLAWYYLRLEDVQTAREFIDEGLVLFEKHHELYGMAQAQRHLGKAALLDGLDERYLPNILAGENFSQAEHHYEQSLALRKQLQAEGHDQSMAIADMRLDFGRLYWLQGMKLERDGRLQQNSNLLDLAPKKYKLADDVSEEARLEFERMSLREEVAKGRIAKAWGNRGNATKELASYMAGNHQLACAKEYADAAKFHYGKNLSLGKAILKKDEIAHALAGLAEVAVIECSRIDLSMPMGKRKSLMEQAREHAQMAHRLYEELAGPRRQTGDARDIPAKETRDEIRTRQLIEQIECLLRSLPG